MSVVYAWNMVNPTLCYGRDGLLQELLKKLPGSPQFSFGIAGGRRMGKTTLLRRVELELQTQLETWRSGGLRVIPLYVDGLALPRPLTPAGVWISLLRTLQDALPEQTVAIPQAPDFDEFKEVLQAVLPNLAEQRLG